MGTYGLMIDYEFCTGCHSCEVACKQRLGLPVGQWGIKLIEDKPWQIDEDTWEYKWLPVPTQLCDMCEDRIEKGKLPTCVLHCCSHVIEYGTVDELAVKMKGKGSKAVLFLP
ncbi:MAG: oxidoreductase [Actinobacteria bacterium]|nr:oxidoreductase [Actinomycetota bacterium]